MKIKKLIKLLGVIEGKLPQDMYELGSYTKQNGSWVGIDDMDFIHLMRAFQKISNRLEELALSQAIWDDAFNPAKDIPVYTNNAPRYAFAEVPNNMYGQSFVTAVKEYINRDRYKVRVRGQYLDHDKMGKGETWKNFEREVPLDRAKCIRIYLDEKK